MKQRLLKTRDLPGLKNLEALALTSEKIAFLKRFLRRIDITAGNPVSVLLAGSFLTKDCYLDIDLMVIFPHRDGFKNYIQIEVIDNTKAEIFFESYDSIRARLIHEQRNNLNGLRSLLHHSVDLMMRSSVLQDLRNISTEISKMPCLPMSSTLLATYMHNGLLCIDKASTHADKVALALDILNIYRQGYHLIRGAETQGSLKHFFRRLEDEDRQNSELLLGALQDLFAGDAIHYVSFMRNWLCATGLTPAASSTLKDGKFLIRRQTDTSPDDGYNLN